MKVLVTGASSGLGAALARHYAARGAEVALAGRNRDRLAVQADLIAAAGGRPGPMLQFDVGNPGAAREALQAYLRDHGVPDLVIANAGVSVGTLGDDPDSIAVLSRVLATNVTGLAATLTPFAAPMRARGNGTLCGIASVAGVRGLPGSGAYSSSKAAAITWMESLRVEMHGSGVRVVTACPGYIDTPMTRVNGYRMPFLLDADEGARRIARGIDAGRARFTVPWQMAIAARALALLPAPLYDALFARAPRKPRDLPL